MAKRKDEFSEKSAQEQYDLITSALRAEFEEPRDSKCRRLSNELSYMVQAPHESVDQFAFRFKNILHQLEKMGENLVEQCPNYVVSQFVSKVQAQLTPHLTMRASKFKPLDAAIEAARRIENSFSPNQPTVSKPHANLDDWQINSTALHTAPKSVATSEPKACWNCGSTQHLQRNCNSRANIAKKPAPKQQEICRNFNRFESARCENMQNKLTCKAGCLHQCSYPFCSKWGCKAIRHKPQPQIAMTSQTKKLEDSARNTSSQMSTNVTESSATSLRANASVSTQENSTAQTNVVFGLPTVTNNMPTIACPDMSNKNILWTQVTSAGVSLPMPIDSCCSVSLVSQAHADVVLQKGPDFDYKKLDKPLLISLADPKASLSSTGIMQIPITWNSGQETVFSMLVVPHLAWPILFGENHLQATKAVVDHGDLQINFLHPNMRFQINCRRESPMSAVPFNTPGMFTPQSPHTSATCLFTVVPPTNIHTKHHTLHHGINFVTVCLTVCASLIGFMGGGSNLWLEGNQIQPGVTSLDGPISWDSVTNSETTSHLDRPAVNCEACPVEPTLEQSDLDLPDLTTEYYTTIAIKSNIKSASIPFNVTLGQVRHATSSDMATYHQAVDNTAEQLADGWYAWAQTQQTVSDSHAAVNVTNLQNGRETNLSHTHKPWQIYSQNTEMINAGLDSSVLSPFSDTYESSDKPEFLPTTDAPLDPHSQEYHEKLVAALGLDSDSYSHVDPDIMKQFKQYLHEFPTAFLLPNSPLTTIKGFEHTVDTGNAEPVYKPPYRKSPQDLRAVRDEIEQMLKLKIIEPSNSMGSTVHPSFNIYDLREDNCTEQEQCELPTQEQYDLSTQGLKLLGKNFNRDLALVAYKFGQYLAKLPNKTAIASEVCKYVYNEMPEARAILNAHGKLKGLTSKCPYLSMHGAVQGGTYVIKLDKELFSAIH